MNDPGPLQGVDITPHLQSPDSFGVTTGRSPDGVPTVEFTTDPAVQGSHGAVRVERAAAGAPRLHAAFEFGRRGRVTCESDDSIRVWGRFAPEVQVLVRAAEAVRLVARTPGGTVLAGPVLVAPTAPLASLRW